MTEKEIVNQMAEIIYQGCSDVNKCMDCDCYEITLQLRGKCKEHYIAKRIYEEVFCKIVDVEPSSSPEVDNERI